MMKGRVLGGPTSGHLDVIPYFVIIMKELKQVYGRFESLHFNQGRELIKVTHSSLEKHGHSPYLQRSASFT